MEIKKIVSNKRRTWLFEFFFRRFWQKINRFLEDLRSFEEENRNRIDLSRHGKAVKYFMCIVQHLNESIL